MHDPTNIKCKHPLDRPKGFIRVKRQCKKIEDHGEFMQIAKQSTARILKNIKDNPLIIQEVQFKLNQDIDGGLLVSLKDFLNREEVKQQGYTHHNILEYLTASALLLVFNPSSSSTKIRICVDPARPSKTGATVNDSFFPGHHHIPQISNCIIKAQFSLSHVLADISNFYTNHQLDEQGALLSAVLLQTPSEGSKYPTLDPNRDVPLQLFVFVEAKFGYKEQEV